jgi:putative membrane protein
VELLLIVIISFIAFLHLGFLFLEMFMWKTPSGRKIFKIDAEFANKTAVLAANQGLYNGFLSAGLIWSLCARNPEQSFQLKLFFLACVLLAGVFGAITASRNILFLQAFPAMAALIILFIA